MTLPEYTELSGFAIRKNGRKIKTDLTIGMIVDRTSDPVQTINSVYQYTQKSDKKIEFIIVNPDRESFSFENLKDNFKYLRFLLPRQKISFAEALLLINEEALSGHVLMLDERCTLINLQLELMESYFTQNALGAIIPSVVNNEGEYLPSIIKGSLESGFLESLSIQKKGSAMTTFFPKYPCFIFSREALKGLSPTFTLFKNQEYALFALGYQLWASGKILFYSDNFKTVYRGAEIPDIRFRHHSEYLMFNLIYINDSDVVKKRKKTLRRHLLKLALTFQWKSIAQLFSTIKLAKSYRSEINFPIDARIIIKSVNKDYE